MKVDQKPELKVISMQDDYISHLITVASEVRIKIAKNEEVDPHEVINLFVDPTKNNSELERVLVEGGLMTKAEFKQAVKRKARDENTKNELGYLPQNVGEYIRGFVEKHKIKVLLNGELSRKWEVTIGDQIITSEDRQDRAIDAYYRTRANRTYNTEDLKLDLRVLRDAVRLAYSDSQIADAVQFWFRNEKDVRRGNMYDHITYRKGIATGPEGQAMWEKMEKAAFDTSHTSPGFAIAVVKKFMWQIKRKGMGLTVTNHLMPVITGKQGGGKSTLVSSMLAPIADGVKSATFSDIADNRLIDMWSTPVLFMDEMSGAKKADMNTVKQAITASSLTRRPMRTNTDVQVAQLATFIGCANEGLGEIIRDNTGIRRFAELEFAQEPDWKTMAEIDWLMLWHSVDEMGDDPSILVMETLKAQQEKNRNMCSVETWARDNVGSFPNWTKTSKLHEAFTLWEKDKFPSYNTSVAMFGRRMNGLLTQHKNLGWEFQSKSGYSWLKS